MAGIRIIRKKGVALIVVLWVVVLVAILLGGFVMVARSENLQSRFLFDQVRARYFAEAGLHRAVYELQRIDPMSKWVADGRSYDWSFEGAEIQIEITDENGKIDINNVDDRTLLAFLSLFVPEPEKAQALADAILDWRDPDDLTRPYGAEDKDYADQDLRYGAADFPFSTIGELQQVKGMDYELYRKLEPYITVVSKNGVPNPAYAPELVLQTIPGVGPDLARQIVAQRRQMTPQQMSVSPILLPNGQPLVAGGGGLTYTVRSRATLPNGTAAVVDATVRLGGASPDGRPFSILRWQWVAADAEEELAPKQQSPHPG